MLCQFEKKFVKICEILQISKKFLHTYTYLNYVFYWLLMVYKTETFSIHWRIY
jgi:hypothetical protein